MSFVVEREDERDEMKGSRRRLSSYLRFIEAENTQEIRRKIMRIYTATRRRQCDLEKPHGRSGEIIRAIEVLSPVIAVKAYRRLGKAHIMNHWQQRRRSGVLNLP